AYAADYTIIAPAATGGGWDQTARSLQTALQQDKISGNVQVQNVPGAGGTIGLALQIVDEFSPRTRHRLMRKARIVIDEHRRLEG
ncbi:hypothetical protein AB9F45_37550, partial [Rhizobium leguminosarum]